MVRFAELWKELQKFADGKSSFDVVKDYFNLFWDAAHTSNELDKESIAKAESLHVALEAFEVGSFSKKNFLELVKKTT